MGVAAQLEVCRSLDGYVDLDLEVHVGGTAGAVDASQSQSMGLVCWGHQRPCGSHGSRGLGRAGVCGASPVHSVD